MARPIAILGMHRSNTSMVASILGDCGIDLGPGKEMLPAAADNPEGFGEDRRFLEINDELLAAMGGRWELPPELPDGWSKGPLIDPNVKTARALIEQRQTSTLWAWKDPRTCLTIEFWKRLLPDLQVVHCVRDPMEVAQSLLFRESVPLEVGLELWTKYNAMVVRQSNEENTIVTHTDSYFSDCPSELQRVLEFLCIPAQADMVAKACTRVRGSLSKSLLLDAIPFPEETQALYDRLCVRAGSVYKQLASDSKYGHQHGRANDQELRKTVGQLSRALTDLAKHNYEHVLAFRDALIVLKGKDEQIEQLRVQLDSWDRTGNDIQALSLRLDNIQKSFWFRVGRRLKLL